MPVVAGKYALKRLVGSGSMGEVYEAVHLEIGRRVAVKILSSTYADSPEVVARFRREARAASAVESDFIVQVFDAGRDPALGLYIVSEFLTGEDLEARLAREGRLDVVAAATLGWQLARGLARAHAAGVIHRDIKPANVFLTVKDDDTVIAKLLDFGISKVRSEVGSDEAPASRRDVDLTAAGLTLGTPQYMSPEQVQALPDVDGRTDVWSLSAVVYEALAGRPAFEERASAYEVLVSIVQGAPAPLQQIAPWVPAPLAEIVHAGLERDRARRIPDAATLAARFKHAVPELALASSGRLSLAEIAPQPPAEEEIPVSVAWDAAPAAEDEDAPLTTRDPSPPLPSEAPPSSTADRVEIFRRLPEIGKKEKPAR